MNKLKIFKQDTLIIEDRIILSKDSFMQMDNITRVWYGRMEVNVPVLKLISVFVIGIGFLGIPYLSALGILSMLGVIGVAAYYYYLWKHYTLSFELSSGQIYAFTTLNNEFLEKSYRKVKEIMNNEKDSGTYEINFNSCKIDVVSGNSGPVNINNVNNSTNTSIDNSVNSNNVNCNNSDINFEMINSELSALLKTSGEKMEEADKNIIKNAMDLAKNKDENGLKKSLKKLSKKALNVIEASSSLATLADFISKFFQ